MKECRYDTLGNFTDDDLLLDVPSLFNIKRAQAMPQKMKEDAKDKECFMLEEVQKAIMERQVI